jgi:hypothetical protein
MIAVFLSSSAYAIDCQANLPQKRIGHWSYRIIDGRKCWYAGKAMISKSMLRWPAAKAQPISHDPEPVTRETKVASRNMQPATRETKVASREVQPAVREAQGAPREVQPGSGEAQSTQRELAPVSQEPTGSIVVDQFEARWRKLAPEVKWLVPAAKWPVAQWPLAK